MAKTRYEGGCHCDRVRFVVHGDLSAATLCNCSICTKKGFIHLIVPPEDFELISGRDDLSTYEFNTKTAKHHFCRVCGMHPLRHLRLLTAVALLACSRNETQSVTAESSARVEPTVHDVCAKAKSEGSIAWIHDDYDAALSCAKAKQVPLVVDLWAPWCHSCLSMKTTVLMDAAFAADANNFVFAAIDTDRESSAAVLAKFPVAAWPTYYVVSPDEVVLGRFVGTASVAQFRAFLDTGAKALSGAVALSPEAHLLASERALAAKDLETAARELDLAVSQAPLNWPRLPDALVSLIRTKSKRQDLSGCLEVAEKHLDKTGNSASASDFLSYALTCAEEYAKNNSDKAQITRVKALREMAVARWTALLDDTNAPLSVDDRSDVLLNLRETLIVLGREDQAKTIAERQRVLLDEAANKAPSPMAAMTYNWPRAELYVYLGRPLDLAPALQKSAQDLPHEYDPPARLGWVLFKAGKFQDAATWTDKALSLVQGPRKARLLEQRAQIAHKLGDKVTEKSLRQQAVQTLEALPRSQTTPELLAQAKQALTATE